MVGGPLVARGWPLATTSLGKDVRVRNSISCTELEGMWLGNGTERSSVSRLSFTYHKQSKAVVSGSWHPYENLFSLYIYSLINIMQYDTLSLLHNNCNYSTKKLSTFWSKCCNFCEVKEVYKWAHIWVFFSLILKLKIVGWGLNVGFGENNHCLGVNCSS